MNSAEELALRITGDSQGAQAALKDLEGTAKSLLEGLKSTIVDGCGPMGEAFLATTTLGVALGAALVELAAHAREVGADLERVSLTTGIAVPALSDLKFAVESAGGSFDQINNSMFMFQQRMENSGSKVEQGLEQIGLSLGALKSLTPDQQFLAISDALRSAGENTNKAAVAFDIFGRQGRDLLPLLLKPLGELVDKNKELALGWSGEDAEAAEKFEIKLNTVKTTAEATWTQLGLHVSIADEFSYAYERMKLAVANVALTFEEDLKFALDGLELSLEQLGIVGPGLINEILADLPKVAGPATDSLKKLNEQVKARAILAPSLNEALANEKDALKADEEQTKKKTESDRLAGEELKKITRAIDDYKMALEGTTPAEREHLTAIQQIIAAGPLEEGVHQRVTKALGELLAKTQDAPPALRAWYDANKPVLESTKTLGYSLLPDASAEMARMNALIHPLDASLLNLGIVTIPFLNDATNRTIDGVKTFNASIRIMTLDDIPHAGTAVRDLGSVITDDLGKAVTDLPKIFERAFTGGGGIDGAIKAIGVDIADSLIKPLKGAAKEAVSAGAAGAAALGGTTEGSLGAAVAGTASTIGGAAIATTAWGTSMAATAAGTIALGAATLGIGAAAVGAYALIKHYIHTVSDDVKAARKDVETFDESLWNLLTPTEALEAKGQGWAATTIVVRDAYLKVGYSAAEAQAAVDALAQSAGRSDAAAKAAIASVSAVIQQAQAMAQAADAAQKNLIADTNAYTAAGVSSQGQMNLAISSTLEAFDAEVKKTGDLSGALKNLGPTLDTIAKGETDLGLKGNAAIDELLHIRDVTASNKNLMDSISASTALLKDLGTAGVLTRDDLLKFGQDAFNSFTILTSKTGDAREAMVMMQPELQALWSEQAKFGDITDESTKKLLDQATQQGLIGPDMQSDNDKMLLVLQQIRDVIADATGQTGKFAKAINDLPTEKTVYVKTVTETDTTTADTASTGGLVTAHGIQHLAKGTSRVLPFPRFLAKGTDTVPAMLTPGEAVLNTRAAATVGPDMIRRLNQGEGLSGLGGMVINNYIDAHGSMFQDRQSMDDLAEVISDRIAKNFRGFAKVNVA